MFPLPDSPLEEYQHFFEVRLDLFDGPIDLLLHLVKQRELPIEKVSLAEVATQYFACIDQAKALDLELAAEYLVIAATLLSLKSSVLLHEPVELVADEDGNLVDPHEELLQRLRELEVYKDGAMKLMSRELLGVDVFAPPSCLDGVEPPPIRYKDHDPLLLGRAFRKLLDRVRDDGGLTITLDHVSIVERMMTIIDLLKKEGGAVAFYRLIPDLSSRASIIGSFIALLELCKRHVIQVRQDENFGEIAIALSEAEVELGSLSSEFDDSFRKDSIANG